MKTPEQLSAKDLIAERKKISSSKAHTEHTSVGARVPVKLSSVGKLGLPAVIHVRDYSYNDALTLASANTAVGVIKAITEVIANVVEEDIDLSMLTSADVMEILMTIQGSWYSPSIELPYTIDEDKEPTRENTSKATIYINKIKTVPFPEDKKVPIEVSDDSVGFSATVDIPRFYNDVIVDEYISAKYAAMDNRMDLIHDKIKKNTNTPEEYKQYLQYKEDKTTDTIKATQAMQVLSINGTPLNTLEERMSAMDKFPLRAWSAVNTYIQEDLAFGVDPEVEFRCTVTGKSITRRFPFRILDFLPTMESLLHAGDHVSIR